MSDNSDKMDSRPDDRDRPVSPGGRDFLGGFLFDDPKKGPAGETANESANNTAPDTAPDTALDATSDTAPEGSLEERVVEALRAIYDPEIPVNIYDLGLIYGVEIDADNHVTVTMTLTTPHCPVAEIMPAEVENRARAVEGASGATVDLVWDPPWDPSKMSEEAQLELGFI